MPTLYHLVHSFQSKIKDIDPELITAYEKICAIKENSDQYIPGISAQAKAGDASGAWAAIMTMLAQVESQY